jgi:hypothetical protein
MSVDIKIRQIGETEQALYVDPAAVGCGFLLFPKEMAKMVRIEDVDVALNTNKTELWAAVRAHNPSIPLHLMSSNVEISPRDAVTALNSLGRYAGYNIALDPMMLSPDGGKTFVTVYAGFNWRSSSASGSQEVIVAPPQKILPIGLKVTRPGQASSLPGAVDFPPGLFETTCRVLGVSWAIGLLLLVVFKAGSNLAGAMGLPEAARMGFGAVSSGLVAVFRGKRLWNWLWKKWFGPAR